MERGDREASELGLKTGIMRKILLLILLLIPNFMDSQSRKPLTEEEKRVIIYKGTEAPFSGKYYNFNEEGTYLCRQCGAPLYKSGDKFDSGCGWPSFSQPIQKDLIAEKKDTSHGMIRTEVRSKTGDAHLGHVFTDGPKEKGGLRYCINSASLRFIPKDKMKEEGYGEYLPLVK